MKLTHIRTHILNPRCWKFLLLVCLTGVFLAQVAAIVGVSMSTVRAEADKAYGRPPSQLTNRRGARHVRKSRKKRVRRKRGQKELRLRHKSNLARKPRPRIKKTAGLTIKVFDGKGRPVPNITLAAAIRNVEGQEVVAKKVTNANGQLVLEKVGPLPAVVEFDSASPRWELADVQSASFEIDPSTNSMNYEIAKVQPALLNLRIRGAAGARLSSYAMTEVKDEDAEDYRDPLPQQVPALETIDAEEELDVPAANLEDGDVPLVLARDLPGGRAESIVYNFDAEAETDTVQAGTPRLASVNSVTINGGLSVLCTDDEVEKKADKKLNSLWRMPKDNLEKNTNLVYDAADGLTDGSMWWVYPQHGLAVKERPTLQDKNLHVTEQIRLLKPEGGEVAGLRVGSSLDELRSTLGEPDAADVQKLPSDRFAMMSKIGPLPKPTPTPKPPKSKDKSSQPVTATIGIPVAAPSTTPVDQLQIDSYMDGGIRFAHDGKNIVWIDLLRSNELLTKGTISFTRGERARVFVSGYGEFTDLTKRNIRINLDDLESFRNYLRRLPSIDVVDSEDEADLVLNVDKVEFKEDRDSLLGSLIPYDYKCWTSLQYDLRDVATDKMIAENKILMGEAGASFRKDIYLALGGGAVLGKVLGGDTGTAAVFLVAAGTLYHLKRAMQKAANRCPGVSERQVFDTLTGEVNSEVDFRAQVTDIDYKTGLLTLNVGKRDGVFESTPDRPFEFEIAVGGQPLLDKSEDGRNADYYTAVVKEVFEDKSICELRHIHGSLRTVTPPPNSNNPDIAAKNVLEFKNDTALEVVNTLPNAATGILAARAWTRFASVTVISDEEIRRSDEEEARQRAAREEEQRKAAEAARAQQSQQRRKN